MSQFKILVVDDEAAIRDLLSLTLQQGGYDCIAAADGREALSMVADQRPNLLLLDWMMPQMSGIELLRRLRRDELTAALPVILLTAKSDEQNIIQGLDAGADDYIGKPFSPRELLSRIKAVLRRSAGPMLGETLQLGGLSLNVAERSLSCAGSEINIGPTEFNLLQFFMAHPERAYSRGQLLDHVWGLGAYIDERTVDVHIQRLRKTLQRAGESGCAHFVKTVRGVGYRFSVKDND